MAPRKMTKPTKQPKMVKLEGFLSDFDGEVNTRLEQLQEKKSQMLRDLRNNYNVALIKLPASVRKMSWMEYFKFEQLNSPEADDAKRQKETAGVENVMADDHGVLTKAVKKTSKKRTAKSGLNDENTPPKTSRKGKTARKPPTTSKRAKALSVSQQKSSITRSSKNSMVTPARTLLDTSLMGPTPLITPRFDPRLPKTSGVRIPRHKERVYSISINGSPISAANEEITINIPVGNGESIQLLASQMESVDLSQLGETTLRSMRCLQNRLTSLCGSKH
ncbi:borealin [Vanacampus margaritifer]